MIRRFLLAILLCGIGAAASAQTVSQTLAWTQPSDTLVNIQNYAFTLVVTPAAGTAGAPLLLTAACVAPPAPATIGAACSAPLVSVVPAGASLVLTATATPSATETSAGSTSSAPYVFLPPSAPGTPVSVSIVIKVNVP
jgi:hypothetical protein